MQCTVCMKPSEGESKEKEDWAEEVNVKVTTTEASDKGTVEKDEQKERDFKKLQKDDL